MSYPPCKKIMSERPLQELELITSVGNGVRYVEPNPPCIFMKEHIEQFASAPKIYIEKEEINGNTVYHVHGVTMEGSKVDDYYIFSKEVANVVDILLRDPFQIVLLHGPPGTGKTSIATIISQYFGFPQIIIDPSNILSKYVGESEKTLVSLFNEARKKSPSIILLDEGEWVLGTRAVSGGDNMNVVSRNLTNIVLKELNNIRERREKISVLITTNVNIDSIDPAVRSRATLSVVVEPPSYEAILEFLKRKKVEKIKMEGYEMTPDEFARYAVNRGFTFRQIAYIVKTGIINDEGIVPVTRVFPMRALSQYSVEFLKEVFEKELKFTCDMHVRLSIETPYPVVTKALLTDYFADVCSLPIFAPSSNTKPEEFITILKQFKRVVAMLHLPQYNQIYYNIATDLYSSPDLKFIFIIDENDENTKKLAIHRSYLITQNEFLQAVYNVLSRDIKFNIKVKSLLSAIFEAEGVDINNIYLRGENAPPDVQYIEDVLRLSKPLSNIRDVKALAEVFMELNRIIPMLRKNRF